VISMTKASWAVWQVFELTSDEAVQGFYGHVHNINIDLDHRWRGPPVKPKSK
jgi:hypothetical protein